MLYVLSVRQKVPKNSALGKNLPSAKLGCARCKTQASLVFTRWHKLLQAPFARAAKASPRSGTCSPLQAFDCFQGAAELVLCGYIRKFIPAQNFGQSSHNGLKTVGLALDFSTVPFRLRRRITFWREYISTGNSKEIPAPLKNTSKVLLVFGNSGRTV